MYGEVMSQHSHHLQGYGNEFAIRICPSGGVYKRGSEEGQHLL